MMGRYSRAMARACLPPRGQPAGGAGYWPLPLPCHDPQAATVGRCLRATPRVIRTDGARRTGGGLFRPRPGPAIDSPSRPYEGLVRLRPGPSMPRNSGPR